MIKKLLLSFTIFISFAFANNSLESQIAKLQTVPKTQRYKLMNQIKRELAKMNATQRANALNKLKATIHSSSHTSNSISMGSHTYKNTKDMNSHMQQGAANMSSHIHNDTKHFINKTHLHEHINKPIKPHIPSKPHMPSEPHTPSKPHMPKAPIEHKTPGGHINPSYPKGPYGK